VALGNWGAEEVVPVLKRALTDPAPLVRQHAAWALGAVRCEAARSALGEALVTEGDAAVREELARALGA